MAWRIALCACVFFLLPTFTFAAEPGDHAPLDVPVWTVLPFVGLLLSIALLPIFAPHFWHSNIRKGLVAGLFALPAAAYLYYLETTGQPGIHALLHGLQEYSSFIILLFALYTISGGIVVEGSFRPTPLVNTSFLAIGAVLANFIGTTGASMVLIRPVLRINRERKYASHIPIFFIFAVSNLGGMLTPLGDPPLFLGFLRGVSFFWTLQLWPQWLVANGVVLAIFLFWDTWVGLREEAVIQTPAETSTPFRLRGLMNLLFLAGVLATVLLQSRAVSQPINDSVGGILPTIDVQLFYPAPEIAMLILAMLALFFTPREFRAANGFAWDAIIEVAVLFAGIFVAMIPALELLAGNSASLGLTHPAQYYWLTGALSSFLDNAPTYLTFATIAAGDPTGFAELAARSPRLLAAISCGAVMFGAMTYIGNGPNFMVKAIAEGSGYKTPSFFGYMFYSCSVLVPIFVLVTYLFFWP